MRIIVTGGTGLIGSQLAQKLVSAQHEVIVLSRNPQKHTFPTGVTGEKWDGKTAEQWGHLVEETDAIINLASESIGGDSFPPPRWTEERKQRIINSRVDGGKAIVEAVKQAENKPSVLIQISGLDYYGNVPNDNEVTETSPKGEGFLSDVTVAWEASTAEVEAMGVRRIVARTGMVLSMEAGALPQTAMPFHFFSGGPLGNGNQWWPWVHEVDVSRALVYLLENESASGIYNICAPYPVQNKQFAKELGQAMKRPSFIPAPTFALKLILGEMAAIVLDGRRAVPQKLTESGFTFRYPALREALLDLINQ